MKYTYSELRELFQLTEPAPLSEGEIDKICKHFGAIPQALEDYYRTCGNCTEMNSSQDFLLTPDGKYHYKLERWNYKRYSVFYVENQCVSVWGIKKSDLGLENPPVYETYNGRTWYKTCDTVSQFLISQAYLQAVFSFKHSIEEFYPINSEQLDQIAGHFPHTNADSSLYTGVRFFQPYSDTVIAVLSNGENNYELLYSSMNEEHFAEVDSFITNLLESETDHVSIDEELEEEYELFPDFVRSVRLFGDGIESYLLGAGFRDCQKIYDMVCSREIPEAERTEKDYPFNCCIYLTGKNLAAFLQRAYPEHYSKLADKIDPEAEYRISSIDFS